MYNPNMEAAREVFNDAIKELVEVAFSGNIERRHHLESAVDCFASIGDLIKAEKILTELFEPEEDSL